MGLPSFSLGALRHVFLCFCYTAGRVITSSFLVALLWYLYYHLILFQMAVSVLWLRVCHHDSFLVVLGVTVECLWAYTHEWTFDKLINCDVFRTLGKSSNGFFGLVRETLRLRL